MRVALILAIVALQLSTRLALALSEEDKSDRSVALNWLADVDRGKYDEASVQVTAEVRSFDEWLNYFTTHRAPLGRVIKRQFIEVKHTSVVPGIADVRRFHVVRFKTSFERAPAAIEEVVMAKMGCCSEIFSYTISDR